MNNEQATQTPVSPPNAAQGRPLWRSFVVFLGPMVLANILQSLTGTINGIFVGQLLGTQALAAVAGGFPGVFLFLLLGVGPGAGASVLLGAAWGGGGPPKVEGGAGAGAGLGLAAR